MSKPSNRVEPSPAEHVRQALSKEILTGELPPGAIITESRLAERFGVSRTPVREAIRVLAGDGLVQLRPGRRPVVRGKSVAEMLDQFEAMAELEASCAYLAAKRRDPFLLERMQGAQVQCRKFAEADDIDRYYAANVVFHEAIYTMAGNAYLKDETLRLRDRLEFLRISQGRLPGRLFQSAEEHERIYAALEAGNEVKAAIEMRNHMMIQGERLRVMLRTTDLGGFVAVTGVPEQ
ncbi:MAG: GntR family transcriptional regulator [Magnetospiraceae bacterium]